MTWHVHRASNQSALQGFEDTTLRDSMQTALRIGPVVVRFSLEEPGRVAALLVAPGHLANLPDGPRGAVVDVLSHLRPPDDEPHVLDEAYQPLVDCALDETLGQVPLYEANIAFDNHVAAKASEVADLFDLPLSAVGVTPSQTQQRLRLPPPDDGTAWPVLWSRLNEAIRPGHYDFGNALRLHEGRLELQTGAAVDAGELHPPIVFAWCRDGEEVIDRAILAADDGGGGDGMIRYRSADEMAAGAAGNWMVGTEVPDPADLDLAAEEVYLARQYQLLDWRQSRLEELGMPDAIIG